MNEIIITVFFINSNVTVRVVDRNWVVLLLLWYTQRGHSVGRNRGRTSITESLVIYNPFPKAIIRHSVPTQLVVVFVFLLVRLVAHQQYRQ